MRIDSVNLLSQKSDENNVREVLMSALRYDKNPGVRLKALEGLKGVIKTDTRVRDAVLEALMHDANSGVRSEALRVLQPVKADSSVRITLEELARTDKNRTSSWNRSACWARFHNCNKYVQHCEQLGLLEQASEGS